MLRTLGTRAARGQTCSVPHTPIGTTGAPVMAASRAAPLLPLSTGSKNASPRGIVPCGMITTGSPASSASAANRNDWVGPPWRSTQIPPMARAI